MSHDILASLQPRIFCTYFDWNYLPKGLALYESLRTHARSFVLYVLCLDDRTYRHLLRLDASNLAPVSLERLEAADPCLLEAKSNRKLIEYYFTCTATFSRYVLTLRDDHQEITYLDSDLFFFDSPESVFDEIGDASIAIIPHRFSARTYLNRRSGLFNVGWITWRRDQEGLRCLEDYRRRCLEWCYDYFEGLRFADQRYLDTWPMDYQGVHIIAHPGANVAVWNLDTFPMTMRAGRVTVAGRPLIFFHFHGHKRRPDGRYERGEKSYVKEPALLPAAEVLDAVFAPYEAVLDRLAADLGDFASVRHAAPHPAAGCPEWEYRPQGWVDDEDALGWQAPSAVAAIEARTRMVLRRLGTPAPMGGDLTMHNHAMVLGYALARAGLTKQRLSLLDWQGGLGLSRLLLASLLPDLEIDYSCVTLPVMVDRGRQLVPDATFLTDAEAALERRYDVVLASGSLQHERDWEDVLCRLARATERWLVLLRLPLVFSVPSFVQLRRLYRSDYGTAVQSWAMSFRRFETVLADCDMQLERQFFYPDRPYVPEAPEQVETMGFLYEARTG